MNRIDLPPTRTLKRYSFARLCSRLHSVERLKRVMKQGAADRLRFIRADMILVRGELREAAERIDELKRIERRSLSVIARLENAVDDS